MGKLVDYEDNDFKIKDKIKVNEKIFKEIMIDLMK